MKISFLVIGKTSEKYLLQGIEIYKKRLKKYTNFELKVIGGLKASTKMSVEEVKGKEGERILKQIQPEDFVILLDERGSQLTSVQFAQQLQGYFNRSLRHIQFVCGGAYGFSDAVYQRANAQISLSKMTFSHQMVRLFFVEQLYRAFTILNHEPYHHL